MLALALALAVVSPLRAKVIEEEAPNDSQIAESQHSSMIVSTDLKSSASGEFPWVLLQILKILL